tara:strand:- start:1124 stop:1423 length:300 start_codon:yes stop_codon:yes gene_type:complete
VVLLKGGVFLSVRVFAVTSRPIGSAPLSLAAIPISEEFMQNGTAIGDTARPRALVPNELCRQSVSAARDEVWQMGVEGQVTRRKRIPTLITGMSKGSYG